MTDLNVWVCPICDDVQRQPKLISEVGHMCGPTLKPRWTKYEKKEKVEVK